MLTHVVESEAGEGDTSIEITDQIHVLQLLDNWIFEAFLEEIVLSLLDGSGICSLKVLHLVDLFELSFFYLILLILVQSFSLLFDDLVVDLRFCLLNQTQRHSKLSFQFVGSFVENLLVVSLEFLALNCASLAILLNVLTILLQVIFPSGL